MATAPLISQGAKDAAEACNISNSLKDNWLSAVCNHSEAFTLPVTIIIGAFACLRIHDNVKPWDIARDHWESDGPQVNYTGPHETTVRTILSVFNEINTELTKHGVVTTDSRRSWRNAYAVVLYFICYDPNFDLKAWMQDSEPFRLSDSAKADEEVVVLRDWIKYEAEILSSREIHEESNSSSGPSSSETGSTFSELGSGSESGSPTG